MIQSVVYLFVCVDVNEETGLTSRSDASAKDKHRNKLHVEVYKGQVNYKQNRVTKKKTLAPRSDQIEEKKQTNE